jgi:peptidyl-prolyl cis-trans isomerase D
MPYFKNKDGKFDSSHYNQVLNANRYSPAAFEEMVRADLLRSHLAEFIRSRVKVSEKEVEQEFQISENRRQIEYVILTRDTAKKLLVVKDRDVQDLLKTEAGRNAVKLYYEQNKMDYMKPMPKAAKKTPKPEYVPLKQVEKKVAIEVLKERRTEEMNKINRELANALLIKAKAGQLRAFAKTKGLEVKTSEKFNQLQRFIPGIGEMPRLMTDAFSDGSPLASGPQLYEHNGRYVVAQRLKAYRPRQADFAKERERLQDQVVARKSQQLHEQWIGDLRQHAKVKVSQSLERENI